MAQTRRATSSATACFTRSPIASESSGAIVAPIASGRPVRTAWRALSIPASSFFIGVTKASIPCCRSVVVTSDMSMPASASALSSAPGSRSALPGSMWPRSATARSVFIGIVLTVSGATRLSTYIVSE